MLYTRHVAPATLQQACQNAAMTELLFFAEATDADPLSGTVSNEQLVELLLCFWVVHLLQKLRDVHLVEPLLVEGTRTFCLEVQMEQVLRR